MIDQDILDELEEALTEMFAEEAEKDKVCPLVNTVSEIYPWKKDDKPTIAPPVESDCQCGAWKAWGEDCQGWLHQEYCKLHKTHAECDRQAAQRKANDRTKRR